MDTYLRRRDRSLKMTKRSDVLSLNHLLVGAHWCGVFGARRIPKRPRARGGAILKGFYLGFDAWGRVLRKAKKREGSITGTKSQTLFVLLIAI